ncbi:MAG: lipoate--protein ligase family protein [Firmicutes bacterium]|jgi:lipoate-protein ligase A|nr:lipoate--protein ligase family protein [Bacillota bacterium]
MDMEEWRLLDPGPMPAWKQMALDKVVIEARADGQVPNTLRFMEFSPHTALVGYHQAVDLEIDRDEARRIGVDINRRITGGGAIYMDERQLGWELCVRFDKDKRIRPEALYPKLAQVVIESLKSWGIEAKFRPVNDVEIEGRKISGTGGSDYRGAVIYQGTLLLDFNVEIMLRVLKLPIEKLTDKVIDSFQKRLVTMREILGYMPAMDDVKRSVKEALTRVLGVKLTPSELSPEEKRAWDAIQPFYHTDKWIDLRKVPNPIENYPVHSLTYKAPGGLLRILLQTDVGQKHIKKAFITGDFFVYPERAVLDLEAALKEAPLRLKDLSDILKAHYRQNFNYMGVGVNDWLQALATVCDQNQEGLL